MISQRQKRDAIGWVKIQNPKVENAINHSQFIQEIGRMSPGSEEREIYISKHQKEYGEILAQLLIICGYANYLRNSNNEKNNNAAKFRDNFDNLLFYEQYDKALLGWNSTNENGVKLFHNYMIDGYVDIKYNERNEEKRKHQNTGCSQHVIKIANMVKQVIPAIEQQGGDLAEIVDKSIQVVKRDNPQIKESTWKNVDRYLRKGFDVMHLDVVAKDSEGEDVGIFKDLISDPDAMTEDEIIEKMTMQEKFLAAYQFMIQRIDGATNKDRSWLRRGYTGIIVKSLKYDGAHPTKLKEPAGNESLYNLLKPIAHPIMKNVVDQDFINYIIEDVPKSLYTLEGVHWNLFQEGRLVTNKCLAECIQQTEYVTAATVSNRLNALGVSFAKI